jgi:predicted Zn-dependent peptidase
MIHVKYKKLLQHMKRTLILTFLLLMLVVAGSYSQSQTATRDFVSIPGDPLKARIYRLENGLTVYISVYKNEPRIQTYIAVRAGSKNDPTDATGLAHYLEHMLFKGTDKFGTVNYNAEKPLIDEIIALYEKYRKSKNQTDRKKIYRQIDSVSQLASRYAIPNEYDKMLSILGATGTNAYTWVEQTVYTNDIPANQLENWIKIEAERFRNPVMRLFHTELETVYEEKNMSLDDDGDRAWEELMLNLFPEHPYGTQTTIGTTEHLKNPSIKKVLEYYNTYYVPNNMAICLSGDIDPDRTIELIEKYWGSKQPVEVPPFITAPQKSLSSPVEKEVRGTDAEFLYIGYRLPGANTRGTDLAHLADMILSNKTAGLLDLNLNQKQKVLGSSSFILDMKDYSAHILSGNPREGQSLEEVKNLILEQVELLKKGEFPDWLPSAVINDLKLSEIKKLESNRSRAHEFVDAFIKGIPWEDHVNRINRFSIYTKRDIVEFANEFYKDNYVVVYKRKGEKKSVQISKPEITPIEINRTDKSAFFAEIENSEPEDIQPVFLDYSRDINLYRLENNIELLYKNNDENDLFKLALQFDFGSNSDKRIPLATGLINYLGTEGLSPSEIRSEFYRLGCSYSISSGYDNITVTLEGLNENFDKALILLKSLLIKPAADNSSLENLVNDIIKVRKDNKLNKDKILWDAMLEYARYGEKSPFTNILSEAELRNIKTYEITDIIASLLNYRHRIIYYGPFKADEIQGKLNEIYITETTGTLDPPAAEIFKPLDLSDNEVYFVNYPEMVQTEIILISPKGYYDKNKVPQARLYNEYFGSGMSSVVFQEIRESKALAYSTFSSFTIPQRKENYHYNMAYLGTQADKFEEAVRSLLDILKNMPVSEQSFNTAKEQIINKLKTERITRDNIIWNYINSQKLGIDYDIRKDVYEFVRGSDISDVISFHRDNVSSSFYKILILGDKNKINTDYLNNLGRVKYLDMETIFGY